jgi:hypothetical protein
MHDYDACILGAGASGLFCALTAARLGQTVAVVDHNAACGRKLRLTGGGRCNFGNVSVDASHYFCANANFCLSALARFPAQAFGDFLRDNGLDTNQEPGGKLFCRQGAGPVTDLLERLCRDSGVKFHLNTRIKDVDSAQGFRVKLLGREILTRKLVVATGGLAWPQVGATCFGYGLAEKFGLKVLEPRPALVPLNMGPDWAYSALAGVSLLVTVQAGQTVFTDHMLFTHQGLSGPAILQLSGSLAPGQALRLDLLPGQDIREILAATRPGKTLTKTVLARLLPARLAASLLPRELGEKPVAQLRAEETAFLAGRLSNWEITPLKTGGYAKAEVTAGGVDTRELSSKTMECQKVPGLYFVGEVQDVTGQLGGYNLHWAWASGQACGQAIGS